MPNDKNSDNDSLHTSSIGVTSGIGTDQNYGAVTPPLYLNSTYLFKQLDEIPKYDYGRGGNPNRDALATALADMEGGAGAVITSSGLAAIDLTLNLVPNGGLVVAPHDCYGGTYRLLNTRENQGRFSVEYFDQGDADALTTILAKRPDYVLIETPSNPIMRIVDVRALSAAFKKVGALVVADNTFLSPARQNPIKLGADIVVHSSTKYINGHSDIVGGAVIVKTQQMAEDLAWWANCTGVTGAPFDSFLTLRGLRTLFARMDAQEKNAIKLAQFLEAHDLVSQVYYPGLKSDVGYELAASQQTGPGAMLSFELNAAKVGGRAGVAKFLSGTKLFQLAESLGGTETLICHPSSMTHRAMDEAAQITAGIGETLIRVSVGLEHTDDQIREMRNMFNLLID